IFPFLWLNPFPARYQWRCHWNSRQSPTRLSRTRRQAWTERRKLIEVPHRATDSLIGGRLSVIRVAFGSTRFTGSSCAIHCFATPVANGTLRGTARKPRQTVFPASIPQYQKEGPVLYVQ